MALGRWRLRLVEIRRSPLTAGNFAGELGISGAKRPEGQTR